MSPTTTITYGSEITADSVATISSLDPAHASLAEFQALSFLIVSRDGSRRILRTAEGTLLNVINYPAYANKPLSALSGSFQRWEGCRLVALSVPREPGQQVLLWNAGTHRTGAPKKKHMVGLYVPYDGSPTAELSEEPVNHVPTVRAVRAELADIAHGWDLFWHSRYVFQNHLRQQVTSRLVDGLLKYGWELIKTAEAAARPAVTPTWSIKIGIAADLTRMAVGPITGDPAMWGRRLARNINLDTFRTRLDKGHVPGVDTRATPWGPTAETLLQTIPTGNVNETKAAIAEWHEAHQLHTEDTILRYHDGEMQLPVERSFGYDDSHAHDPLA